jgi:hypothetical protein
MTDLIKQNQSASNFVDEMQNKGFGGTNNDINNRLSNSFNQWTGIKDSNCEYVNQIRVSTTPFKYYLNRIAAPSPTSNIDFSYFTSVGNQRPYNVNNNLQFPVIGTPTTQRNRRYINNVTPLNTSPLLGSNNINTSDIDVNSKYIRYGEMTNQNDLTRSVLSATDYNRWQFVDPTIVQNSKHIIFANGVIPRNGLSSRQELRNFMELSNC